jgi:hypothetical protein
MRKRSHLSVLCAALLSIILVGCAEDAESVMEPAEDMGVDAQPAVPLPPSNDEFFQLNTLLDIEIEMVENDWNSLRYQTQTLDQVLGGDCLDGPRPNPFSYFNANVTSTGQPSMTSVSAKKAS